MCFQRSLAPFPTLHPLKANLAGLPGQDEFLQRVLPGDSFEGCFEEEVFEGAQGRPALERRAGCTEHKGPQGGK